MTYTTRVRRLRYAWPVSKEDDLILARVHNLTKGQSIFTNLRYLQLERWPLSVSEAYLLFNPKLHILDLSNPCGENRQTSSSRRYWGRLSTIQQQQLCIQTIRQRCRALQVFRCLMALGIWEMQFLPSNVRKSTRKARHARRASPAAMYRGTVDLTSELLERISRTENLLSLCLDNSKPTASSIHGRNQSLIQSLATFSLMPLPTAHIPPCRSLPYRCPSSH